ncbi:MAG: DNA primase [Culturomica sp.]|jgi:DNA primase|nr:DNA primase [Culturomica sp.]
MIEQATIQKVFDAADIYEVVSEFVHLRKRGVNYVGCCPFHNEKTGSFTVSPSKGIFKCFGCGKVGNVVGFIMEHEQMNYIEAIKWLATKYNITVEEKELTEEQKLEKTQRESMLVLTKFAQEYFAEQLMNTDEGISVGMGYLKRRGLDEETIRKFGLGYCPEAYDGFSKHASDAGYKKEFLVKTGLSIERDNGNLIDRFRERVIFPIRDIAGKVIAFGGRIMKNDVKSAKYVNSPESEIYHKSNTLYGIYFAKKSIVQNDRCYLVEGYLDVISFHTRGIENTVASSGTSLTVEQIRLIRRLTSNVTVIYDGDSAGIKASLRGIDLILEEGLNVKVVSLPEGDDPDSFAQSHTEDEIKEYIRTHETDFIKFKVGLLIEQAGNDPVEKAKLITSIVHTIALIPDNITRSVYIKEASSMMNLDEAVLLDEIVRLRKGKKLTEQERGFISAKKQETTAANVDMQAKKTAADKTSCDTEEMMLIRYLLLFGKRRLYETADDSTSVGEYIISELREDELTMLNIAAQRIIVDYTDNMYNADFVPEKFFTLHSDPDVCKMSANVLSEPYELSKIWRIKENSIIMEDMILADLLPKIMDNYKIRLVEMMASETNSKILEMQTAQNDDALMELLRKKASIDKIRSRLTKKLRRTGVK